MTRDNYKVSDTTSPRRFDQTDFGRIYYNNPSEYKEPESLEELASLLKHYNKEKKQVTIRNTGHSTNGQTVTGGVQINISKLRGINFDEKNMEVKVGAGNSWHETLEAINFPQYCLPIFPHNPNQEIQVGGTAAVGGLGFYSFSQGGFWNHIKSIKLVTMKGDIIECSKEKNFDYFRYSLVGYGRIGVIGEMTINVEESKSKLLALDLVYHKEKDFLKDYLFSVKENVFKGAMSQMQVNMPKLIKKTNVRPHTLMLFKEVKEESDVKKLMEYVKKNYNYDLIFFARDGKVGKEWDHTMDFSFHEHFLHKKNLVYWHPNYSTEELNQNDLCHPWSDYIIPKDGYLEFMNKIREVIKKHEVSQYITREAAFHKHLDADMIGSAVVRRLDKREYFPISLDLNDDFCFNVGVFFTTPSQEVEKVERVVNELTDLCYELGGKRYLYGLHNLTKEQVIKHFGKSTIKEWNKIKKELDPNNLLNTEAIPHLN